MKIKVIYRNYKPLHDLWASFIIEPPRGAAFSIPEPKRYLRYLLPLHRRLGNLALVRFATSKVQEFFFQSGTDDCDLYHFVQMISKSVPQRPYVIDFEHVSALVGFSRITPLVARQILHFLDNPRCCKVIPLTFAARKSLMYLLGDAYERIADKVEVVYPALPNYYAPFRDKVDYSYVNPDPKVFKILFVGSRVYNKGLHELLVAFREFSSVHDDVMLYVISDAPKALQRKYASETIKHFAPRFSHDDIVRKFYLPCDLFVLPTHGDTFGMALLYSLACGTPVLTTSQFAIPELVRSGRNGYFVHSDRLYLEAVSLPDRTSKKQFDKANTMVEQVLVSELVSRMEYLYANRGILERMSQQAIKDFEPGGRFSIDVRNRKLGEIYRSCLCR